MDTNVFQGKWRQFRGEIMERWGKLTNDKLDQTEGKVEQLVGALQEEYGYARARAEKEVNDFVLQLSEDDEE